MKTIAFFGLLILAGFSQDQKSDIAQVDKINGVYVFIHSRPTREYDVVKSGTVTSWGTVLKTGTHTNELVNKPIKHAQKENGDGVIIYLETQKYDVIRFR